jgi:transposase
MEFAENIYWKNGQPIDERERNLILLFHGQNYSDQDIARMIGRDVRTVKNWLQKFHTTGKMHAGKGSGRPRKTTRDQDLDIVIAANADPFRTRLEIKRASRVNLHVKTISKRLKENGIFCRVSRIKESLSAGHRAARMHFSQNFANFNEWHNTVFVDEATFQTGHAVQTLVWRPIGLHTAYQEQYITPKAQSGRKSVSVFGIMSARGLGPLIRINGRFNSEKYIDIINNTVLPYVEDEFPAENFYYYQDNSPIHRSRIVTQWLDRNFIPGQLVRPPPKSPDINPIENVWGMQKIRVADSGLYDSEDELWLSIADAWNDIRDRDNDNTLCINLINSMPRRLQLVREANGGHTKY